MKPYLLATVTYAAAKNYLSDRSSWRRMNGKPSVVKSRLFKTLVALSLWSPLPLVTATTLQIEFRTGKPLLILAGDAGTRTQIQFTSDLSTNDWAVLTNALLFGSSQLFHDLLFEGAASRFYRAARIEAADTNTVPETVLLDGEVRGRVFEGIGALSAGASSRLLIDYPEPARSRILDYLFKPAYGAAFHHFKVEIGGDINSTDGCEPSHMHTRDDENYHRGYEWWLMKEAKSRNPSIFLDCLEWGAPAWVGNGSFFSEDNVNYIVKFLQGAQRVHGLTINYVGIWNERVFNPPWIKLLRAGLDQNHLEHVRIVAADQVGDWGIAEHVASDSELAQAVDIIGVHYSVYQSTPTARQLGKPLWSSEDGSWDGTWKGGQVLMRLYNRNYIVGQMTKTIIWSLVSSYYDNLPLPSSGVMRANTPWSGAYEVQPAIWVTAHTTQFAHPGWQYLAGAGCGFLSEGGSCVTLRAPQSSDYSVIIETADAKRQQQVTFRTSGGLSSNNVHVWRSTADEQFVYLGELRPRDGAFTVHVATGAIYSITTTLGQQKGGAVGPVPSAFPSPYLEDFESYSDNTLPKYFSDQAGIFEVAERPDTSGKCLRQVIANKGIEWQPMPEPETFLGDLTWINVEVSVDALIQPGGNTNSYVSVFARVGRLGQNAEPPPAYTLRAYQDSTWQLRAGVAMLASGEYSTNSVRWHNLKLRVLGSEISAFIDGTQITNITDTAYASGLVGIGSGWHHAHFDNFSINVLPRAALEPVVPRAFND